MSLHSIRCCTRFLSPQFVRKLTPKVESLNQMAYMSSSPPTKPVKASKPKADSKAASAPVEKGDTYAVGPIFYSHKSYSFYDIEFDMASKRIPQPSSQKASS